MTFDEQPIEVLSGDLQLEGRYHAGVGKLAAVVLHPHPQYGGDMDNHVVLAVCEEFAAAGASTLRFNFRGTGRSQGSYDGGNGEIADARAACARLRELHVEQSVILVGYSFGAMIAVAASTSGELAALALISPPLAMTTMVIPLGLRTLVVTGDRDTVSPAPAARELASANVRVTIVPGADHGWWPGSAELRSALAGFASAL